MYESERDNDAAIVDDRIVCCARPSVVSFTAPASCVEQVEPPRVDRLSSTMESVHPMQLSMIQTRVLM